jgi:hypothetical protein
MVSLYLSYYVINLGLTEENGTSVGDIGYLLISYEILSILYCILSEFYYLYLR